MAKKTTIILDDDIYIMLVNLSIKNYGSARHISKVINDILREKLMESSEDPLSKLRELLSAPRLARISPREFEVFRKKLSERFES